MVTLVSATRYIYSPMYFFLSHLSLSDILLITTIEPPMIHIILEEGSAMSLPGCFAQFYFFSVSAATECLLLTVMSYDRYLAIYSPLRYSSIMDLKLCIRLVILCWASGVLISFSHVVNFSQMTFCGSNIINHLFCDLVPILKVSCSGRLGSEIGNIVLAITMVFCPFIFIFVTYVSIFLTILRISSSDGRQKAFSTCSSHLAVVCIYYGTLIFNYLVPSTEEYLGLQKLVSAFYTMVTPLLNPIIYSLRNGEIRRELLKYTCKRKKGIMQITTHGT